MRFSLCSFIGFALLFALPASAQQPFTGYEIALSGVHQAIAGQPTRIRGTAYRVRGLAELSRFPRAQITARLSRGEDRPAEPWVGVSADSNGHFEIAVPIPRNDVERAALEVRVSEGEQSRSFQFPLHVQSALDVLLRTDRVLYERGETIHVWALVRERGSFRPLAGEVAEVELEGPAIGLVRRNITTGEDGVVSVDVPIGPSAQEGTVSVRMNLRGDSFRTEARVGSRNYARMLADIRALPGLAAPHAPITIEVKVTTPSGAPISNAEVHLHIDDQVTASGTTSQDGVARIEAHAPAYHTHDTGWVVLSADVRHPAHGSATAHGLLQLEVPLTLHIEAVARLGSLVAEVDDVLYVLLSDTRGDPPQSATEVEVTGAAVRNGRALVMTDAHGIAEVPVRLPQGAWSSGPMSTVHVRVHGPLEQTARLSIDVSPDAEVAPHVRQPVVTPGARFDVEIVRGPSARNEPIVVELLDELRVLATRHVGPNEPRTSFDAPTDHLGLLAVRARAVHEDEVWEGGGAIDCVLVRPARPTFASLRTERTQHIVGETARVSLQTTPADRGFAALLVRDIAAHDGEESFRYHFLQGAFDESILAATPEAERLVRTAFAARAFSEPEPLRASPLLDALGLPADAISLDGESAGRGVLRDPFPLARELERRGVAVWMLQAEEALANAIASDALTDITTGNGPSRRFRSEILEADTTLGEGPIDIAYIEAVDPSFRYETVARRVARAQLVKVLSALARYLDPGDDASIAARMAARESPERWLPRMIERGLIAEEDLRDPWGGRFTLRRTASPIFVLSVHATNIELVSPGPDGRIGTVDDIRDPFARVVPAGTPYAVASGEDELMRQLALLSPASRTIAAISEAYTRITAEMTEDEIGDAVHADASEGALGFGGMGVIGSGRGGGGSGYGSGALIGVERMGRASPAVRTGGALFGLARVMRERFPATLVFRPSIALDPSGVTELTIPLADAVTSYLVEVIVWRPDGWAWSAETRISAVREIVVDAPVPEVARMGDEIMLPVRVSNRASADRELVVHMLGAPELGIPADDPRTMPVQAQSGAVTFFTVRPSRVGRGQLRVAVSDTHGHAQDAITLPIVVSENSRRARSHTEALVIGSGPLELAIPDGASPEDAEIVLMNADSLFDTVAVDGSTTRMLAVHWSDPRMTDETIAATLRDVTRQLEADPAVETRARALLDLASIMQNIEARGELVRDTRLLISELRQSVANDAALSSDPEVFAFAAATLAFTHAGVDPQAIEMLRRIDRSIVSLGDDQLFVASPNNPMRATALVAMADAALGASDHAHIARALSLLRTLARWSSRGGVLSSDVRGYASMALARLHAGSAASAASITIDGTTHRVDLTHGSGRLELGRLAPGTHRAEVSISGDALTFVRLSASYRLPWEEQRGPFTIATLGQPEGLDRTTEFTLILRNRTARTIAAPIIEVDLPTGAEMSESSRSLLASLSASPPDLRGNVLTLRLRSMPPGVERRLRLPLRLTVGGLLPGLGVTAYAADRPEAVSVVPPRALRIEGDAP